MANSEYLKTLAPDIKERYFNKISIINNIDPYTLKASECFLKVTDVPDVHYVDIVSYFIFTHSFYTSQQLKVYKSLEGFKFYEAGFVQKLMCKKVNENCVIVGEVKHSQRINEKNLQTWLIILPDGSIASAHCTCMAGLGEVCSHVAAIAFALHFRANSEERSSCTDNLALWPVPAVSKIVKPKKLDEINWGKVIEYVDPKLEHVQPLRGSSLEHFLDKLNKACPSAAILSVVEPYASKRVVPDIELNLPMIFTDLHDQNFETFSLAELRDVKIDFSITDEEKNNVRDLTSDQNKSLNWYKFRSGKVTCSFFKRVCHTFVEEPSLSLIKSICYPGQVLFKTQAVSYGLEHEGIAKKEYEAHVSSKHDNFVIKNTGFIISTENPVIGASPDGLVSCDCCGTGCIEIKCPFRLKDPKVDLLTFVAMKNCCLFVNDDGKFHLKEDHEYYYQIQLQMYLSKTTYYDFIVWSKRYLHVERIYPNETFLKEKLCKALEFHKNVIKPELLARWYTLSNSRVKSEQWCVCRNLDDGRPMLRCAYEDCPIQWFHMECMNLIDIPSKFWFCKACSVKLFGHLVTN